MSGKKEKGKKNYLSGAGEVSCNKSSLSDPSSSSNRLAPSSSGFLPSSPDCLTSRTSGNLNAVPGTATNPHVAEKRWGHEAPGHRPAHVLLHFPFGFVAFEANKHYSMVKILLMGKIINQQVCWMHSIWYRVGGLQGTSTFLLQKGRAQFPRNLSCPVL